MRILIFHGYLLRGTGSNVYNASLAQVLRKLGHEVHLFCQDREAAELEWVGPESPSGGSVTVHVPDIGGLLPVFVADRYEGFEVKTFPELNAGELDRYLGANVAAVRAVVEEHGQPGAALANHLIMGPAILARAGLPFATKVHGSDLSYTVGPHPRRFLPLAREGTDSTAALLVGSRHTAEQLWRTMDDSALAPRTRLGPPGVDVERFRPRRPVAAQAALDDLAAGLAADRGGTFGRDGHAAAEALKRWSQADKRVLYVGKLLENKGVQLLVEAWPQVRAEHPDAQLLFAGFGDYRAEVERRIATLGRDADSIAISGRLEHDEIAELMPAADALVMPSVFPEAFGMVAVEAAACGVLPISANHSGMAEVSRRLAESLDPAVGSLLSFDLGEDAAEAIASRLRCWLATPQADRVRVGARLALRAGELWSWERVAEGVIAASEGRLDALQPVSG